MRRSGGLRTLTVAVALAMAGGVTPALADDAGPHPTLLAAADPAANPNRTVPKQAARDPERILRVASARWDDTSDPMRLVWEVRARRRTVACVDCYYLAPHVRRFLAEVLEQPWSRGVESIEGLEPHQRGPGEFAGNGWAVTLNAAADAQGFPTDQGTTTLERGLRWLLGCGSTPCRSQRLGVTVVANANRLWSVPTCARPVRSAAPTLVDRDYETTIRQRASNEVVRFENGRVFAASLYVALPKRAPRYRADGAARIVDGTRPTRCPARG